MHVKKTLCGFAVIKLRLAGEVYYLMRKNLKWHDISFVGGHLNEKDNSHLQRAARRELLEELPSFRKHPAIQLVPLVDEVSHGPVYSPSAKKEVCYQMGFFLVHFGESPQGELDRIGHRSLNLLVKEQELLEPRTYQVASLVKVLNETYPGGIQSIPMSWEEDLENLGAVGSTVLDQQELRLN